jgi:Tol biopolymer transport system component
MIKAVRGAVMAGAALAVSSQASLVPAQAAAAAPPTATVVAVGSAGDASISADGRYVAFVTQAPLAAGDANGVTDVYLRDTRRGTVRRVSLSADGREEPNPAYQPSISPDGRYVAYSSYRENAGGYTSAEVTEVRDLQAPGAVELGDGSGYDRPVGISRGGRYVLIARGTYRGSHEWSADMVLADRAAGTTTVVSTVPGADQGALSDDGRIVAYTGRVLTDPPEAYGVYVRDLRSGTGRRIQSPEPALDQARHQVLSGDGRRLAYLAAGAGGDAVVVVADTAGGPATATGFRGRVGDVVPTSLSRDGRTLALVRRVDTEATDRSQVLVHDCRRGTSRAVLSVAGRSLLDTRPQLSGNGRWLAFSTDQRLSPRDRNNLPDTYIADLRTGAIALISAG